MIFLPPGSTYHLCNTIPCSGEATWHIHLNKTFEGTIDFADLLILFFLRERDAKMALIVKQCKQC